MIDIIKLEGKNEQEILEKFLKENGLNETDIYYIIENTPSKLFKSKKVSLSVIKKENIVMFIKEFFKDLSEKMNLDIKHEINYNSETINILLISDNNSILIGREGRTLNSLQTILKQTLFVQTGLQIKLNLDISNYKAKRMKNLEYEVKSIAKEVLNSKISVTLDPMNSYERRIVHNIISEFPNLESTSEGEGKERKTTIIYKNKA